MRGRAIAGKPSGEYLRAHVHGFGEGGFPACDLGGALEKQNYRVHRASMGLWGASGLMCLKC